MRRDRKCARHPAVDLARRGKNRVVRPEGAAATVVVAVAEVTAAEAVATAAEAATSVRF